MKRDDDFKDRHEHLKDLTDDELEQYNAVIMQICEAYGIKCIDLRKAEVPAMILADGIHPDEFGMGLIKDYIKSQLDE